MRHLTWLLKLLLKAAIFFALFAFALNNQGDVTVNFFFGTRWRGPLVLVVLAVFAAGVVLGVLAMAPRWWAQRRHIPTTNEVATRAPSANSSRVAAAPQHGP